MAFHNYCMVLHGSCIVFHNYCIACHGCCVFFHCYTAFLAHQNHYFFCYISNLIPGFVRKLRNGYGYPCIFMDIRGTHGQRIPTNMGWGGARVCRGCAGPYLRKRLNSQKKSQKNCKKLKSNIVLLHLPLNSSIFTKAQCVCKGALEFSHESVRVNFRRSTDKCGNITRITYNNNKNCKSTFVCYISNAIPGFA